jgi:hypothetical protein
MRNLLRRGGLPDILSSDDLQLTPDRFLLTQRFVTDSVALRSLAASVERRIIFNLPSAV